MTAYFSQQIVFAIFGVICILGVLFVKKFVPESRGRTLEEIEAIGESHNSNKVNAQVKNI